MNSMPLKLTETTQSQIEDPIYLDLLAGPAKREVVSPNSNSKKHKNQTQEAPLNLTLSLSLLPTSSHTAANISHFAPRSSRNLTFNSAIPADPEGLDLSTIKPNKPDLKDFIFYPLTASARAHTLPELNNDNDNDGFDSYSEQLVLGLPVKFQEDIVVSSSVPRYKAEATGLLSDEPVNAEKDYLNDLILYPQIFEESEDHDGMEQLKKAEEMPRFFKYGASKFSVTGSSSEKVISPQTSHQGDILLPWSTIITPLKTTFNLNETHSILVTDTDELKTTTEPPACELHFSIAEEDGPQSLETMIKFKEAEAEMYQSLADDARKEVAQYQQIINTKSKRLKAEYRSLLAKMSLLETEKLMINVLVDQLKFIASSHFDYNNMIMRMKDETSGFLKDYGSGCKTNSKSMGENYGSLFANLRLLETEEWMTNVLEDQLKFLESSQFGYNNMIMRMQDEVASLLEEIETMRQSV